MKGNLRQFVQSILKIRTKWITIFLPTLALGIFLFMMSLNNVFTETYDIERFTSAKQTIRSPITIENEQETERKTRETVQAVEDRYRISEEVTQEQIGYVEEIFDAISKLEAETNADDDAADNEEALHHLSDQEKLIQLKEILSLNIVENVNDTVLLKLMKVAEDEREEGQEVFLSSLTEVLEDGVRAENKNSRINMVKESVKYTTLDSELVSALDKLSEFAVVENSFYDAERTMEARKDAANSVDPVFINAGEIIVREGQTITNEVYEKLNLVGLLNNERNVYPVIGLFILILLISSIVANEMNKLHRKNNLDKGKIASILFVSFIVVTLMKVISLYTNQTNQLFYIVPVATGVLLIKLLINERVAVVMAGLYALIGCVLFNGQIPGALNVEAGIYFFFSQMAGIIFLRNVKDRFAIVKSGLGMSLVNLMTVLLFIFLSFEKYSFVDLLTYSGFALAAAFLSAVLTIGLLSFFESGLGILSDVKLLQLSSPNQPLLKKILTEAPGTYHHSIMVANLSETACEAVGANGLLARVGAYYHDIGKTVRPHYFIENQLAIKNPHDVIAPKQSAEIIINHPYAGAEMLKKYKLPKEIIDIAMQHHGTTLLKYFYFKEKETNPKVKEADYRYPGPKPQTKEAAIICICDSVEAAVRSLKEPTEEKIEEIVSSIVNDRLMDGQLDECPLTLREVKTIHRTICETLKGIFHSRIQYPMKEAK
ncbi:hypothetical protein SAMN05216389_11728 [Oceanobacillus limi]|uniref:HD domain-containing protein n=1 Tax=Oceanobacillus limi TaxID=930131 RepID=A0A1I0FUK2_9BACI|nr:HDIG domain-containing metalloprotein [Oceanobacillus limi]SET61341.1 hypothetical protein SAMN05216389_11728 [Oceanobacillus limi]